MEQHRHAGVASGFDAPAPQRLSCVWPVDHAGCVDVYKQRKLAFILHEEWACLLFHRKKSVYNHLTGLHWKAAMHTLTVT